MTDRKHYLVVEGYTSQFGAERHKGDVIIISDSSPPDVAIEMEDEAAKGRVVEVEQSAGVALSPSPSRR